MLFHSSLGQKAPMEQAQTVAKTPPSTGYETAEISLRVLQRGGQTKLASALDQGWPGLAAMAAATSEAILNSGPRFSM